MEALLRLLPAKPQPLSVRIGVIVVLVGLCFLLRVGLYAATGQHGFFLMFPAVFLTAILFDRGSGLVATALSTLLLAYVLTPDGAWHPPREYLLSLSAFAIIASVIVFISEAMRKALELAVLEHQKRDVMLEELAHRFKNNLAMAVSVFTIQARSSGDEAVRAALQAAAGRLNAIAAAHAALVPSEADGAVPMRDYLERLCHGLGDALRDVRPVAMRVQADDLALPANQAVPLGLITNELVTNSIKYAFPDGREGVVTVTLRARGSGIELVVEDDGVGCPPGASEGLGTKVTRLLAKQMGGTARREQSQNGCRTTVSVLMRDAVLVADDG